MNAVVWDMDAKELVKITNGACVLDHSTPAAFKASHAADMGSCIFEPSEAVALRLSHLDAKGRACFGWAYVSIKGHSLSGSSPDAVETFNKLLEAANDIRIGVTQKTVGLRRFR